jgi:hypothetical protein
MMMNRKVNQEKVFLKKILTMIQIKQDNQNLLLEEQMLKVFKIFNKKSMSKHNQILIQIYKK